MSQYHLTVNLDRKEFIDPLVLGDGLALKEQFLGANPGVRSSLMALLSCSNGRGSGDLPNSPIVGRWSGNRIAIIGDYSEPEDIPGVDAAAIYGLCKKAQMAGRSPIMQLKDVQVGVPVFLPDGRGPYRVAARRTESLVGLSEDGTFRQRLEPAWSIVSIATSTPKWTDISIAVAAFLEKAAGGRFKPSHPGSRWMDWQYDMA